MNIAILGAGRVGGSLGRALASQGHDVVVGVREPSKHAAAGYVSLAEAVAAAPLVIHATPGDSALETLRPLRALLAGKVLLDVANATKRLPSGMPGGLCYPDSSLAEKLQEALPETKVVKALNTMLFSVMAAPGSLSHPPTAFLSGNDEAAKAQVATLLADLGWRAEWLLDLGGIESARATEALILLVPHLIRKHGFAPFAIGVVR